MNDAHEAAAALAELFPALYLRLHARHFKRGHRANSAGVAVLQHLAMAGPLTVGEAAVHFARAQSVVSEIVDRLEAAGLVERMRDERDRRRVLVWLTPAGFDELSGQTGQPGPTAETAEKEITMSEAQTSCVSCGMPIEAGPYCNYFVGSDGKLQPFDERFERMVQWQMRHKPALDRKSAEKETLAYMAKMPAWKDHPRLKARG